MSPTFNTHFVRKTAIFMDKLPKTQPPVRKTDVFMDKPPQNEPLVRKTIVFMDNRMYFAIKDYLCGLKAAHTRVEQIKSTDHDDN